MEDQIIHVQKEHHCCQFMYKDWQISLTTVPPQEVAVFKNVKDIRPFKTFRTVAEAVDWVNNKVNKQKVRRRIREAVGAERQRIINNIIGYKL